MKNSREVTRNLVKLDSSVGIATRLLTRQQMTSGLIPGRGKKSLQRKDRLWAPFRLLASRNRGAAAPGEKGGVD
jgi:hypothetical protein